MDDSAIVCDQIIDSHEEEADAEVKSKKRS